MRRTIAAAIGVIAMHAAACVFPPVDLDGKACDEAHPCEEGACVDGTCRLGGGCTSSIDCAPGEVCLLRICRAPFVDAGPPPDAGLRVDAGEPADAGSFADAGDDDGGSDAGGADAGPPADSGPLPVDGGACGDLDPFGVDVTGDCVPDLLVGSPGPISRVQLFAGNPQGGFDVVQQFLPISADGSIGRSIAVEPDPVDDAGRRAFSIGEPEPFAGGEGVVQYLFPIPQGGYAVFTYVGQGAGEHVGSAVAFGEDTFATVLFAGAPGTGVLRAIRPGATGPGSTLDRSPEQLGGASQRGTFGASLRRLPDLTGDGLSELGVGASDVVVDGGPAGAWVISMGSDLPVLVRTLRPPPGVAGFGASVTSVDDVDGDLAPDLLVAAPDDGEGGSVFVAPSTREDGVYVRLAAPDDAPSRAGAAVASMGDLDGDGLDEIVVGAPFRPSTAFVLPGCADVEGAPPSYVGDCGGAIDLYRGADVASAAAQTSPPDVAPACSRAGELGEVLGAALRPLGPAASIGTPRLAVGAPAIPTEAGAVRVFLVTLAADACILAPVSRFERAGGALVGDRFGAAFGE